MADTPRNHLPEEGVNVNVILRCRPSNTQELAERAPQVIQCNDALREVTLYQSVGGKQMSRTFRYDKVFGPDSKQERVYMQAIVPIVQEVLDGFNCTIFAYGQTGTGKTYTMEGGPRNSVDGTNLSAEAGVIPRAIKQIFDAIECNQVTDSSVKVSFMELYNEELTDLLSPGDDKDKKLRLLEDRSGVVVQGLEEMVVKNAAEIYQVLDRGTSKRRTAETLLNKRSSRSHSVFTITIHMKETTPEGEDVIKIGKLNLVDLAGSENISRSGAKDGRAREAGNINQSLLTLGRVITALVEHSGHVPYRDSKLTRLLRDSLGGKTKTCIIATIGPSVQCVEETISTLDYAHRAKNIRNRPELNQRISKTTMIKELTTEIERLKLDLVATREKNGIYISTERYEASELERAQLREQVLKHKAEMEVLATEHMEEMNAITAALETKLMLAQKHTAEMELQLEAANNQLAQAQVVIQEGRFVIMSHQRAEQAISAHAMQLTSDLGDTASELAVVFNRLSSSLQLTQGDRATLQSICELAGSKLGKLQSSLTSAAQAQCNMLQDMQSQVDQFKHRKQQELSSLSSHLAEMQTQIVSTEQLMARAVAHQAETASAALRDVQASEAAATAEMQQAMNTAAEAMTAAVSGLTSSLQAQSGQLMRFAQEQEAAARSAQQYATAGFTRAKQSVHDISSKAQSISNLSEATSAATGAALSRFAVDFEASMAAKQQQLLAQVSSLLAGFVQDRSSAVAGMVVSVQHQLGDGRQQMAAAAAQVAAAADGCVATLEADSAACSKEVQAIQSSLENSLKHARSELAVSCSTTQSLEQQLSKHTEEITAMVQQQATALDTVIGNGSSNIAAFSQDASKQLQVAVQALQSSIQAVESTADNSHKADAALAHQLGSAAGSIKQEASATAAKHSNLLLDVTDAITSDANKQLSKQPPQLPAQKQLEVPPAELVGQLCCPPELVLVEHFREQRRQILERGGDPVEVFGLFAPVPDADKDGSSDPGSADEHTENDAPFLPASPASSVRSAVSLAGDKADSSAPMGKRSRIPTLGRLGLSDRTNVS